jgi:hypothetical protein
MDMTYLGFAGLFFSTSMLCLSVPIVAFVESGPLMGAMCTLIMIGPIGFSLLQMLDAVSRIKE